MKTIITVFLKEVKDIFRDKKTIISSLIVPALLVPGLIFIMGKIQSNLADKESQKTLRIALVGQAPQLMQLLEQSQSQIFAQLSETEAEKQVKSDDLDAAIIIPNGLESQLQQMQSGEITLYYKSNNRIRNERIEAILGEYEALKRDERLAKLNLDETVLQPVQIKRMDKLSSQRKFGEAIGGFIPYIFIIFGFMGCMIPAMDLLAGEKERGTFETLLTVPASRFQILMGKILAITFVGLLPILTLCATMGISLVLFPNIPEVLLTAIQDMLSLQSIALLILLLIPLTLFFAGMTSAIAVRASSIKEAQSYLSPLMIAVILPAAVALLPGIELNWTTVFIPIFNLALASKEIVSGTIQMGHYVTILALFILLAVAAAAISVKQFSRESSLLKG